MKKVSIILLIIILLILLLWFFWPKNIEDNKEKIIRDTVMVFKQLPPDTIIKQKVVYFYRKDTVFVTPDSLGYPKPTKDSLYEILPFVLLDTITTKKQDSILYRFYFPEMNRSYIIKYGIDTSYIYRDTIIKIQKEPFDTWEKIGIFALGVLAGIILGR